MSDLAVIRATFCDWRTVKGRKQLQIILEVPLEQQQDVLTRLGAPDPSNPKWVAVALLDLSSPPKAEANAAKSQQGKDRYRKMPEWERASTRAVLLCKDEAFQRWALNSDLKGVTAETREYLTSGWVKDTLGIKSRKDIASEVRAYGAFIALETEFRQATGQMAEVR